MKEDIKVFCASTTQEIESWLNQASHAGIVYDSLKLTCHSVDNSPSGVIFTVVVKTINKD